MRLTTIRSARSLQDSLLPRTLTDAEGRRTNYFLSSRSVLLQSLASCIPMLSLELRSRTVYTTACPNEVHQPPLFTNIKVPATKEKMVLKKKKKTRYSPVMDLKVAKPEHTPAFVSWLARERFFSTIVHHAHWHWRILLPVHWTFISNLQSQNTFQETKHGHRTHRYSRMMAEACTRLPHQDTRRWR